MKTDKQIRAELEEFKKRFDQLQKEFRAYEKKNLVGKMVSITAKEFRDQPYGRSMPNLSGKNFKVSAAFLDVHLDSVYFYLDGLRRTSISLEEVEFI